MNHNEVIVGGMARTAIGTFGGSLRDVPSVTLATTVVGAAVARSGHSVIHISELTRMGREKMFTFNDLRRHL